MKKGWFRSVRRMGGAAVLPLLGAVALAGGGFGYITAMPGESFRGSLPPLTAEEALLAERLRGHVTQIAREEHNTAHPGQLEDTARYIENTLVSLGLTVRQQLFTVDGNRVRNLEVSFGGTPGPEKPRVIVVGAHYDSAPGTRGANDNASGSAAVIELARAFGNAAPPAGHEVKLVLFVNEEPPYFKTPQMGSWQHAHALHASGERVAAMLALETIGYYSDEKGSQSYPSPLDTLYPDTGNFVGFVGDLGSRALVRRVLGSFRDHTRFPSEGIAAPASLPGIDWSDHWAYRAHGYPAMMITDTAPYRYPHYHTREDTPDKIDYARLARVVKGVELVVRDLASS